MSGTERIYPLVLLALILSLVSGLRAFLWLALAFVALWTVPPTLLLPIAGILERVMRFVGTALSTVVLTIVFFGFVAPYGALYRAFHAPLVKHVRGPAGSASFYTVMPRRYEKDLFEKQW